MPTLLKQLVDAYLGPVTVSRIALFLLYTHIFLWSVFVTRHPEGTFFGATAVGVVDLAAFAIGNIPGVGEMLLVLDILGVSQFLYWYFSAGVAFVMFAAIIIWLPRTITSLGWDRAFIVVSALTLLAAMLGSILGYELPEIAYSIISTTLIYGCWVALFRGESRRVVFGALALIICVFGITAQSAEAATESELINCAICPSAPFNRSNETPPDDHWDGSTNLSDGQFYTEELAFFRGGRGARTAGKTQRPGRAQGKNGAAARAKNLIGNAQKTGKNVAKQFIATVKGPKRAKEFSVHSKFKDVKGNYNTKKYEFHHVPSVSAQLKAKQKQYEYRNQRVMTKKQVAKTKQTITDEGSGIILSKKNHKKTRTYRGKNKKEAKKDAEDLGDAIESDINDLKEIAKEDGVSQKNIAEIEQNIRESVTISK